MSFKIVNKYGQNTLGKTFKTEKQAKEARKRYACEGIVNPKSKIVKTKSKLKTSGFFF